MSIDPKMLLWSIINFVVLFLLLRRFLWKPILGILDSREREVTENLARAENAREEAIKMKEDYERRLAEAQQRAEEIIARATRKAEELRDELSQKAQAEAAAIIERAQEAVEREKEQAKAELREQVADLAVMVAGKVLGRAIDDRDHERLAREFVSQVGEVQ